MKQLLSAVAVLLLLGTLGCAHTQLTDEQLNAKINALEQKTLDLDARYWAHRVAVDPKDITMEQLEENSKQWTGSKELNTQLIAKIKENIRTGNTAPLTEKERAKLTATSEKISDLLMPGRTDKKLQKTLTQDQCVELEARYWTAEITSESYADPANQPTLDQLEAYSKSWAFPEEYKVKLFERIRYHLHHTPNIEITQADEYAMQACSAKF